MGCFCPPPRGCDCLDIKYLVKEARTHIQDCIDRKMRLLNEARRHIEERRAEVLRLNQVCTARHILWSASQNEVRPVVEDGEDSSDAEVEVIPEVIHQDQRGVVLLESIRRTAEGHYAVPQNGIPQNNSFPDDEEVMGWETPRDLRDQRDLNPPVTIGNNRRTWNGRNINLEVHQKLFDLLTCMWVRKEIQGQPPMRDEVDDEIAHIVTQLRLCELEENKGDPWAVSQRKLLYQEYATHTCLHVYVEVLNKILDRREYTFGRNDRIQAFISLLTGTPILGEEFRGSYDPEEPRRESRLEMRELFCPWYYSHTSHEEDDDDSVDDDESHASPPRQVTPIRSHPSFGLMIPVRRGHRPQPTEAELETHRQERILAEELNMDEHENVDDLRLPVASISISISALHRAMPWRRPELDPQVHDRRRPPSTAVRLGPRVRTMVLPPLPQLHRHGRLCQTIAIDMVMITSNLKYCASRREYEKEQEDERVEDERHEIRRRRDIKKQCQNIRRIQARLKYNEQLIERLRISHHQRKAEQLGKDSSTAAVAATVASLPPPLP